MATTVVKTIGAGGDYSTLQSWEDACPADLVTADQIWQGCVKNQVFSSASNLLTISGTTVDATRYVELTTDTGASYLDSASVRTNALRYNEANGAAIKITGAYANAVVVNQNYTRIYKLQFLSTGTSNGYMAGLSVNPAGATDYCDIDRCIFEASNANNGSGFSALSLWGQNTKVRRSLILTKTTYASGYIAYFYFGASAYNCVFASLNANLTVGIYNKYFSPAMQNCAVMNVASLFTGGATWTLTTNKTDAASPPSGFTAAAFSTATFANISDGTHDFRTVTGSALINTGTVDAVNAPADVTGQAWVVGTDIGLWDFASAGGAHLITASNSNQPHTVSAVAISSVGASGTITIAACRQWETGNLRLSESGVTVIVNNLTTGALVVKKTGLTTHATTGICVVNDAAIVAGTPYRVTQILADGNEGTWKYTAS